MSFPKDKPPHSVKVLHSWISAYAKETGQSHCGRKVPRIAE